MLCALWYLTSGLTSSHPVHNQKLSYWCSTSLSSSLQLPDNIQQLHIRQPSTVLCKTRGCLCSFRLLMMGVVSPETCWASFKYGIIKLWYTVASCWIFCMNHTMMHGSMNIMSYIYRPRRMQHLAKLNWKKSRTSQWISMEYRISVSSQKMTIRLQ